MNRNEVILAMTTATATATGTRESGTLSLCDFRYFH
jgi:hypothetical protein